MKYEQFKQLLTKGSKSFKLLNPLVGLQNPERQQADRPALVKEDTREKQSANESSGGSLKFSVIIISMRHRLLDGDNLQTGAKYLRDAIAELIGLDDADKFIRWEYHQLVSVDKEGTIVIVDKL